jgi:hypothetical protein
VLVRNTFSNPALVWEDPMPYLLLNSRPLGVGVRGKTAFSVVALCDYPRRVVGIDVQGHHVGPRKKAATKERNATMPEKGEKKRDESSDATEDFSEALSASHRPGVL